MAILSPIEENISNKNVKQGISVFSFAPVGYLWHLQNLIFLHQIIRNLWINLLQMMTSLKQTRCY